MARAEGLEVGFVRLVNIWPFPGPRLEELLGSAERLIVPEMNLGQYVREIQRVLPDKQVEFVGRMDGSLIPPSMIEEVIYNG